LFFDNSIDTTTSDGSADFDLNVHEPGTRVLTSNFSKIFLLTVYGILFTLGIVSKGLVILVMGYQKKVKTMTDKGFLSMSVHTIYTVNLYSSVLILAFISLNRYLAVVCATNSQATTKLLDVQNLRSSNLPIRGRQRGERRFERDLSAHLPVGKQFEMDGGLPFPAHPGGFRPTQTAHPRLLLYHHHLQSFKTKGQVLKKKALEKTVIFTVCFFGCWLPYCLGIFVDTFTRLNVMSSSCELQLAVETWFSFTERLVYFHCCLNPILHAFLGVKFNQTARTTLAFISSRGWSQKAIPLTNK
ncbi:hypothetical protein GOODEAATRI_020003, partial [Goodea atripinnis]